MHKNAGGKNAAANDSQPTMPEVIPRQNLSGTMVNVPIPCMHAQFQAYTACSYWRVGTRACFEDTVCSRGGCSSCVLLCTPAAVLTTPSTPHFACFLARRQGHLGRDAPAAVRAEPAGDGGPLQGGQAVGVERGGDRKVADLEPAGLDVLRGGDAPVRAGAGRGAGGRAPGCVCVCVCGRGGGGAPPIPAAWRRDAHCGTPSWAQQRIERLESK